MTELFYRASATVAMFVLIAYSFYVVRNTRGKMSEAFKIIIIGHLPMLAFYIVETAAFFVTDFAQSDIKTIFLEQTAQVIAALSVFIAIYIIKRGSFYRSGETENE